MCALKQKKRVNRNKPGNGGPGVAATIVAGDPDLEDLYLCEIVKPADHLAANPLVRVLRIIRYPIQHAIMLPDVVNENVPIAAGTVCRLTEMGAADGCGVLQAFGLQDADRDAVLTVLSLTYAESQRLSAEEYLRRAPPGEAEIVRRHLRGEYGKKRILIHH